MMRSHGSVARFLSNALKFVSGCLSLNTSPNSTQPSFLYIYLHSNICLDIASSQNWSLHYKGLKDYHLTIPTTRILKVNVPGRLAGPIASLPPSGMVREVGNETGLLRRFFTSSPHFRRIRLTNALHNS